MGSPLLPSATSPLQCWLSCEVVSSPLPAEFQRPLSLRLRLWSDAVAQTHGASQQEGLCLLAATYTPCRGAGGVHSLSNPCVPAGTLPPGRYDREGSHPGSGAEPAEPA